jgi:hypothetical protein
MVGCETADDDIGAANRPLAVGNRTTADQERPLLHLRASGPHFDERNDHSRSNPTVNKPGANSGVGQRGCA